MTVSGINIPPAHAIPFLLMLAFASVSMIVTLVELVQGSTLDFPLDAFSIKRNVRMLISRETSSISCLDAVRFLTIMWIVVLHVYGLEKVIEKDSNYLDTSSTISIVGEAVHSVLGVDTFFFMSALLLSKSLLTSMEMTNKINLFRLIANRFLRLGPALWLALSALLLIPYLGTGPLWNETFDKAVGECENWNWFLTLIYFNNNSGGFRRCVEQSWYVSADFQLYFVSACIMPLIHW